MLINLQACQILQVVIDTCVLSYCFIFFSLPLPLVVHDGAWWPCSGCGLGCLLPWLPGTGELMGPQGLVFRVTVSDGNCRGPGKGCCCRFALRRPSVEVTPFSHNFLLWILSPPFCTQCPTHQERREILKRSGDSVYLPNLSKLRTVTLCLELFNKLYGFYLFVCFNWAA